MFPQPPDGAPNSNGTSSAVKKEKTMSCGLPFKLEMKNLEKKGIRKITSKCKLLLLSLSHNPCIPIFLQLSSSQHTAKVFDHQNSTFQKHNNKLTKVNALAVGIGYALIKIHKITYYVLQNKSK